MQNAIGKEEQDRQKKEKNRKGNKKRDCRK
jgi:hypothetical protein